MNRALLFTLAMISFSLAFSQAPPSITWQNCSGGTSSDGARDVLILDNGDRLIVGSASSSDGDVSQSFGNGDVWLTRLDATGSLIWERSYGGSENDGGFSAVQSADGGVVVLAQSKSSDGDLLSNNGEVDLWLFKIDDVGDIQWSSVFGGSQDDYAEQLAIDSSGDLFLLSTSWSNDGDVSNANGATDMWVLKVSSTGSLIWESAFGGSNGEEARAISPDGSGGCYFGGFTSSNNGDVSNFIGGISDAWFVHLDANALIIDEKTFGGNQSDAIRDILPLADGTIICVGDSYSNSGDLNSNQGMDDIWVFKLDNSLSIIWSSSFGGSQFETAAAGRLTAYNETIVWSTSESSNGDVGDNQGGWDNWLLKVDYNGALVWEKNIGSSSFEFAQDIELGNSGEILVCASVGGQGGDITCNGQGNMWSAQLNESNVGLDENPLQKPAVINHGNGQFSLSLSQGSFTRISIHDARGRLLEASQLNASLAEVDLSQRPSGVYLVQWIGTESNGSSALLR